MGIFGEMETYPVVLVFFVLFHFILFLKTELISNKMYKYILPIKYFYIIENQTSDILQNSYL